MTSKTSPLQTDFPITIAGQDFILSFPLPALWAYEDATGIELFKPDSRDQKEIVEEYMRKPLRERMQQTIALLWAGLLTHQPKLTRDQVGSMVFLKDMPAVEAKVMEAYRASFPPTAETSKPVDETAEAETEGESPLAETSAVN